MSTFHLNKADLSIFPTQRIHDNVPNDDDEQLYFYKTQTKHMAGK